MTLQGIIQLEKELAFLGSVCAAALMKKDLALPIGRMFSNGQKNHNDFLKKSRFYEQIYTLTIWVKFICFLTFFNFRQ